MDRLIELGSVFGLRVNARGSAVYALLVLWLALGLFGAFLLGLPPLSAALGGLLAALLHFIANFLHHLGHAYAARRTGHPMSGVTFWWFLAVSRYPSGEGNLPAQVHRRRALGGPMTSLLVSLAGAFTAILASQIGELAWWLAVFFTLDSFLVFTLGSLLPLGFTDGSTLLYWRKGRE